MIIIFISILTLVIAISIVAVLAASETSLFSLSSLQVKAFKEDQDKRKQLVGDLLSRPRDLLVTILMVNIAMNILVQNIIASIFGNYEAWWLNVLIPLLLTLLFGEVIPKSIALSNNIKIAVVIAPLIMSIQWLLGPIRTVLNSITQPISRFFFFFLKKEPEISIEELKHALKTSEKYEILGRGETALIYGYLELEEFLVKEVMTPRTSMLTYSIDEPIEDLKNIILNQKVSRLPIYDQEKDEIVGILKVESLFDLNEKLTNGKQILPFLRKPFFVPESLPAKVLFNQFNFTKRTLAIVVDEYGAVSGIVTKDDLVQKLIKEDQKEEDQLYTKASHDVIIAAASMELSDFNNYFHVNLESESNMATIGGWLIEQLGEIPKNGTKVQKEGFFFHVLSASARKIKTLYIRKLSEVKK